MYSFTYIFAFAAVELDSVPGAEGTIFAGVDPLDLFTTERQISFTEQ